MAARKGRATPAGRSVTRKVDLKEHPLVTQVNPEDNSPSNPVVLIGFIGPSKKTGQVRLYMSLSFDSYVDLPSAGIVATQPVDSQDENSPTRVWVRSDTKIDIVRSVAHTVEASFVRGWIARTHLPHSAPAERSMARGDPAMMDATWEYSCYTFDTLCMSCTKTWVCPA